MTRKVVSLLATLALAAGAAGQGAPPPAPAPPERPPTATAQDFDAPGTGTPFALSRRGAEPGPAVEGKSLAVLDGAKCRGRLHNAAAFARTAPGTHRRVLARFGFLMSKGGLGGGFALLDTAAFGAEGEAPEVPSWEEPNLRGSFAVGLDTFDPPTSHWFDANGNVHDQPERTVSLHWDGREVANALSPVEFRDEKEHRFELDLRFVNGGALATVRIDGTAVHEDRFLAGVRSYESRAAIGGSTGETSTVFQVDDLEVRWEEPAPAAEICREGVRVRAVDGGVIWSGHETVVQEAELPGPGFEAERVVLHWTLGPAPGGWDIWDRCAAVYAYRGEGKERETFEIARFITPFRREGTWSVDVTDYRPLLTGRVAVGAMVGTIAPKAEDPAKQTGFRATVDLEFFPGKPARRPLAVLNLWQTDFRFGNDPESIARAFPELRRAIPAGATGGKLRFTVTGHGQTGEFTPADRTATFDGREFTHRLWTTDCWLNPLRPQGGTWKFHRAGWGPGTRVAPWDVDVSALLAPGKEAVIGYRPHPFPDFPEKGQANHWVDSQLILYGPAAEEGGAPPK